MSVVGIDLGTTNTVVACVRSGKVHVLADEHGARLLPSVVSFHPNGEVLVGAAAKSRRIIDPKNTVYSHKRLIGRSWGSPEIAQAKSRFAFELKEGPGQGPLIRARGQDYTLPEISAFVLKRTRQIAETALGSPVERAVITVPAHFNELQRASTKVAGRVSGLEVLRILNEPTAAALAYGLGRTGNERVAVYDFGGGTFDCTLLDLNGNVFEVLATAGDSFLGGDDVDNLIAERMAETYLKAHRYDPRTDAQMLERLKTTAEEIKMMLSTAETHTVVLKEFGHGAQGSSINFTFTMTRRDLDQMVTPLVDRSFKVTQDALSLARLTPTSFDKVILVGGSTRMPLVRRRVEAFFGQAPLDRVNPDEVVAIGAAIQAAALTEGARKRSIPAPPNVMAKARTLPGLAGSGEQNDPTQTGGLDATQVGKPAPAFASGPPSFGFHPASSPPPATRSGPPPAGSPFSSQQAANTQQQGGPRKITSPGVAPATQPMGARTGADNAGGGAEDPSIASFPDLAVPTPFEWFPSSEGSAGGAAGGEDDTQASAGRQGREMAPTSPGLDTANTAVPLTTPNSGPGFGAIDEPPSLMSSGIRGGSVPSFPSLTQAGTAGAGSMPSPVGEPEPFRGGSIPDGQFGQVKDLSLVSGMSSSGVSRPGAELGFGQLADLSLISTSSATAELDDVTEARKKLSRELDDETEANPRAPVAAGVAAGATAEAPSGLQLEARAPGAAADDDGADLPSLADPSDLPSVAQPRAKRPEIRKPGQPAMTLTGGPSMVGKPPPMLAPQPFGPMEKVGEGGPPSRPGPAVQARSSQAPPAHPSDRPSDRPSGRAPIAGAPARPAVQPARTAAMPARTGQPGDAGQTGPHQPFNTTAPLNQTAPLGQAAPRTGAAPKQPTQPIPMPGPGPERPFGGGLPTSPFGSAPPVFGGGGAAAPQPPMHTAPMGQAPPNARYPGPQPHQQPPQQQPYAMPSQPPPQQPQAYAQPAARQAAPQGWAPQPPPPPPQYAPSAPPPQYAPSAPPNPFSSPPPFGQFASSPPDAPLDVNAMGADYNPSTGMMPGAPPRPPSGMPGPHGQQLGFAAPVLVDVTPRGLVVETAGGYTDTIIPRNAKIPCERTRRFATGRDMQTTVRVRVAQGEGNAFPQNTFLGEVELSGLRPAPRGEVVVAVTFEVDADGTLRVRARDVQTGQEARATLQLIGVADESSVVMMINRFAQQPVVANETPRGPH
ncbi:MAG: Chaperone protein DnaK [Labilithrix sp.]|nr:Chaperone protein DnaK [Labilithrix sp.]